MDITTVLTYLKDLFATIMILLTMMSPAFGGSGKTYRAENPDALVTSFAVVSDIHVETNHPQAYQHLSDVLYGIKDGEDIDTAVYTGDNVMNGQLLENLFFYTALRSIKPAENNFVVAGNHDFGNGAGDYASLRDDFIRFNKLILGNDFGNDYYYNVVNGCYMIVLASEDPNAGDFTMGQQQFSWLEGVLKEAKAADAPIFVFNHFPLRYLDNDSVIHHSQLGPMLRDYGVDLFVHGHIHDDLGTDNFYEYYGINNINLPRITETTNYVAGDGIVVEVYENEILVRGRDFISGEWIDGLEYRHPIG